MEEENEITGPEAEPEMGHGGLGGWQLSFQDVIEGCMMEAKRILNKFLRAEDSETCYTAKAVRPLLEGGNISISLAEK